MCSEFVGVVMSDVAFAGFSPAALNFLRDLKAHNTREWFGAQRTVYEAEIKRPALEFADTLAERVARLTGTPHSPKLFRVHRDVRFSKDKTPYNAHVRISLAPEGPEPAPMWFFGLGVAQLSVGVGLFEFGKALLPGYRAEVMARGPEIDDLLEGLMAEGARVDPPELKRVPHGFPADHPQAELLRHKGLSVWRDYGNPQVASDPDLVEIVMRDYLKLLPVWMFCRGLKAEAG